MILRKYDKFLRTRLICIYTRCPTSAALHFNGEYIIRPIFSSFFPRRGCRSPSPFIEAIDKFFPRCASQRLIRSCVIDRSLSREWEGLESSWKNSSAWCAVNLTHSWRKYSCSGLRLITYPKERFPVDAVFHKNAGASPPVCRCYEIMR